MRRNLLLACCMPLLALMACGDDDDSPVDEGQGAQVPEPEPAAEGASGGEADDVAGEVLGTIEFTGTVYDLDRVTCEDDEWDFAGPIVYGRISVLDDPTLDHDRINVTLDRDEDGEQDPFDDGWENYSIEPEDQPTIEVTDDGFVATGVVWPRGAGPEEREQDRESFVVEATC